MFATLSPGAVGIHGLNLSQLATLARQSGFAGVDAPLEEIAALPEPAQAVEIMQREGLRWGGWGLPVEFRKDDAAFAAGMKQLRKLAPVAQAVGCTRCTTWLMPGHNELDYQANFKQHAERLRQAVAVLAGHGVRLGLEFVGPKTLRDRFKYPFVHNIDQVLELAEAIDPGFQAGAGLLFDSFHYYCSGATPADITGKLRDKVVYVHVNDARPGRTRDQQVDNERALPGDTGVIDLHGFADALAEIGYDGPVAAEPFMNELAQQPASQVAARVAESIRKILAA
jgi:sugar phosphate isomerase/epimerase